MTVDAQQQPVEALAPAGGGVRVDWAPVPKVNLLPREVLDARAFRRVQKLLAGAVVGTVAVAGLAFAWSLHGVQVAQADLDVSRARTAQLHTEEAKYADVPRVLSRVEQAKAARTAALGSDVLWYRFFDDLAAATPDTVSLTNVTVAMDTSGAPTTATDPLTPSGLGAVTFTGGGDRFPDVSTWLESVGSVDGLDGSTLQSATRSAGGGTADDGPVTFSSKIVIDSSALSHRFDGKAS
ncbi:MAG: PilN domain-containing protein [Actinobacteria bacterium]|nr:PilN domain-containing protein [Actinomycetota bacterium]